MGSPDRSAGQTQDRPVNPVKEYPKPPFKSQSQPWPGLCSEMEPRPDHGEDS
ncbi:MAG TPA: NAD(P)-dependent oxidoreductase, partial [Sphingobacterium sp.]|nr:NAD(P)-dependent oxidoreductase [Sphingobacterium sp.]